MTAKVKKPKSAKPYLIGGAVVVALCGAVYFWFFVYDGMTYSEGSRIGVINKFSKKGGTFSWKTHEGELSMGSITQGGVREKWEFSVNDDEMVKEVQKAMDSQKRVKLLYRQQRGVQGWKGKTTYFIVGVEMLDK